MELNWTKREFEVYVLLYAVQCNHLETQEERDYILSKVDEETFNKMHTEITIENEAMNIKKIKHFLAFHEYTDEDKKSLIKDIKQVFFADGTVDLLEKNIFAFLKEIIE